MKQEQSYSTSEKILQNETEQMLKISYGCCRIAHPDDVLAVTFTAFGENGGG